MEEQNKVYYAIGIQLGKSVVKKAGKLKSLHRKFMLDQSKLDYSSYPKERLKKLLDILLLAEVPAIPLVKLLDATPEEQNRAVNFVLNASMKPIVESNEK